jgi:hypothetical protein
VKEARWLEAAEAEEALQAGTQTDRQAGSAG